MLKHIATIRDARILPEDDSRFRRDLRQYDGKRVDVTIKLHREAYSRNLQNYYFGAVIGGVMEHFGYGPEDKDSVHFSLKKKFLPWHVDENGFEIVPSFTSLDGKEAHEYIEHIRRWMLTEFGCDIPSSDQVPTEEYELR